MTHDDYSTAADKVFRDGTLFPQPYLRRQSPPATRRSKAAGTRVGVRLMIEPKSCRQSDGTYGRAPSRISDQILAAALANAFLIQRSDGAIQ
jgi:hypothetical protein